MITKTITLSKEVSFSRNYNTLKAGIHKTIELNPNDKFDYKTEWAEINQQLQIETADTDPFWIRAESKGK